MSTLLYALRAPLLHHVGREHLVIDGVVVFGPGVMIRRPRDCDFHADDRGCAEAFWSPCMQPERPPDRHMAVDNNEDCRACNWFLDLVDYDPDDLPLMTSTV